MDGSWYLVAELNMLKLGMKMVSILFRKLSWPTKTIKRINLWLLTELLEANMKIMKKRKVHKFSAKSLSPSLWE